MHAMADEPIPLPPRPRPARGCPICGAPADARARPFCSARCAQRDLHRWLTEGYRLPTDEPPDPGGTSGDGQA
jgi:endogenous inhibitor of DNA gyrase (YacG/DUF329 family)